MVQQLHTPTRRDFLCGVAAVSTTTGMALQDGPRQRTWPSRFPALGQEVNGRPLAYLDSAATTLRPQSVIDALVEYYSTDNANPAKVHQLASRASERLNQARAAVAQFIGATDPLEVVFVRGTTEGINLIASTGATANLRHGDEVVISVAEHYSNLLPWTRAAERAGAVVRVADVDDEGRLTPERLSAMLSKRTRLVAFSHVSNVLGYVNPVRELTTAAKSVGAVVVVDGAQGAPHVAVDVQEFGCDFYVFSGHKMLGPMATGVLWGRRELLDRMAPYHVGSNMAHNVSLTAAEFETGALKFQAGTPDVAGPVGLRAAISFFQQAGREALQRHDDDLAQYGLTRLRDVPGLRLIGPASPTHRVPVFTFSLSGMSAATIASALDQQGIAVRAGDMAALPLLKRFGVSEAVRASAYIYTGRPEIDRLAVALGQLARSPR